MTFNKSLLLRSGILRSRDADDDLESFQLVFSV